MYINLNLKYKHDRTQPDSYPLTPGNNQGKNNSDGGHLYNRAECAGIFYVVLLQIPLCD